MGEGIRTDPYDHAILILRAIRAGVLTIDDRARRYTFEGKTLELGPYTDDGSYLSSRMAERIRAAVEA